MPLECEGVRCALSGEAWLRQLDVRTLLASGAFANKKLALLRNGKEAHHVDVESTAYQAGEWPSQFLFLPNSAHVFNNPEHADLWRHWIRHSLSGADTATLDIQVNGSPSDLSVLVSVQGQAEIVGADLLIKASYDGNFGSLDSVSAFQEQCSASNTCPSQWRSWTTICGPITLDGTSISVAACDLQLDPALRIALVLVATIDDGSGDLSSVSTPVTLL